MQNVKSEQEELETLISSLEALMNTYKDVNEAIMGRKKWEVLEDALKFLYSYKIITRIEDAGGNFSVEAKETLVDATKKLSKVTKKEKKTRNKSVSTEDDALMEVNALITGLEAILSSCDDGVIIDGQKQSNILENTLRFVLAYKTASVMDRIVPTGDDMLCFPDEIKDDVNRLIELNVKHSGGMEG